MFFGRLLSLRLLKGIIAITKTDLTFNYFNKGNIMDKNKKQSVALAAAAAFLVGTTAQASPQLPPETVEASKLLSQGLENGGMQRKSSSGPRNKPKVPQNPKHKIN